MNIFGEIRRRARHIVGPVAGITLLVYFVYHMVQGDRGLIAWLKLSQQVEIARVEYNDVLARRVEFANRVSLLHPASLDRDLLEERARGTLGLGHPDDLVILDEIRIRDGKDVAGFYPSGRPRGTGSYPSRRK